MAYTSTEAAAAMLGAAAMTPIGWKRKGTPVSIAGH
jgi:hypothetical protein